VNNLEASVFQFFFALWSVVSRSALIASDIAEQSVYSSAQRGRPERRRGTAHGSLSAGTEMGEQERDEEENETNRGDVSESR